MAYECDRCGERKAEVGIWDDNVLCGRIDAICDDCYEQGHRIRRPIEPPYNEDGELYWHIRLIECPLCGNTHEVSITDNMALCPRRRAEGADIDEVMYHIDDATIIESGVEA